MTLTRLLTVAGAAALLAGAAHAQTSETTTTVDVTGVETTTTTVDTATSATTVGVPASSVTVSATGAPGTMTTRVVTNGPVPDTAENRAKYGPPLSRAGRATTPAGN